MPAPEVLFVARQVDIVQASGKVMLADGIFVQTFLAAPHAGRIDLPDAGLAAEFTPDLSHQFQGTSATPLVGVVEEILGEVPTGPGVPEDFVLCV